MNKPMDVYETLIFISKPIEEMVASLSSMAAPRKIVDGSEVAYLYQGRGPDKTSFGFAADLDAPEGRAWTHLLAGDDNPRALAALLKQLRVKISQLRPATDWNGNPLVELDPIRKEIERGEARAKPAAEAAPIKEVPAKAAAKTPGKAAATKSAARTKRPAKAK
jgi:hypothetical protein